MRTFVCAVDGSESARQAGRMAAMLLQECEDAQLLAVYVSTEPRGLHGGSRTAKDGRVLVADEIRRDLFDNILACVAPRVIFRHLVGSHPAQTLCQAAKDEGAQLLIVGQHAAKVWNYVWPSSFSQVVIHTSEVPVLIVPENPAQPRFHLRKFRKIVYATDGTQSSAVTSRFVQQLMTSLPYAQLLSLYVTDNSATVFAPLPGHYYFIESRRAQDIIQTLLTETFANFADRHHVFSEEGSPVQKICALAQDHRADLVVMGSHGAGLIGRLLVGRVGETVVHRTKIPVVIVNHPRAVAEDAVQTEVNGAIV